jgi:hypothetical protein
VVLNKRERIIAFTTAGVLALLAVDRVAISPLFERRDRVDAEYDTATVQLQRADQLFANGPRMNARWHDMVQAGLKAEVTDAESQALHALHDWAADSGLSLMSLQPDKVERAKKGQTDFQTLTLRASGTGSMRSISRFLYRVQTATIPLRVTDVQISSRKEGTDDLMLTLAVSTLVQMPQATPAPGAPAGPRPSPSNTVALVGEGGR